MKFIAILLVIISYNTDIFGQLELSSGYAVNKNLADGIPINVGYDIKIKNKLYIKPQIGYKYLYHFNDYVGAKIKVNIFEFHQTVSYQIIKKEKYIFKPNLGLNYRYYKWRGRMVEPLNSLPQRVYKIEFRDDKLRLNSFGTGYKDSYEVGNLGFSLQLQNQFKINKKIWFTVTPFIEPDYDRTQNTGGCYLGIIFNQL